MIDKFALAGIRAKNPKFQRLWSEFMVKAPQAKTPREIAREVCAEQAYKQDTNEWKRYLAGELDHTVWMRLVEKGISVYARQNG